MKKEIEKVVEVLKNGGTILYPTDTIWGIGCDATSEEAVEKINLVKQRPVAKSLIVLLEDENQLERYVKTVPEIAYDLLAQIDTPLTIIYPEGQNVAKNILANDRSLAVRIAKDDFCRQLLRAFKKPIVSTSANLTGDPPPHSFRQVNQRIIENVDYVVKLFHERLTAVKPSSIIKLGPGGEIELIRK